jgi:plastocyanin
MLVGALTLIASALGAAVAHATPPPTLTISAQTTPAPAPAARAPSLVASPSHPAAGATVRLDVVHPPAGATDYRWDLDASGAYATNTGPSPSVRHVFPAPGIHRIAVRVTVGTTTELARLELSVRARRHVVGARRVVRHPARAAAATKRPLVSARPRIHAVRARAASDPGVAISDFKFGPASVTVHVGDTVTWSNNGPSSHTATARNGSFDTGTLAGGSGGSHTFGQAGTFAYYCKIHPFMHGTVVVLASAATTPSKTTTTTTPSPTTTTKSAGPSLPFTGYDVEGPLTVAIAMIAAGLALRVAVSRRPRAPG